MSKCHVCEEGVDAGAEVIAVFGKLSKRVGCQLQSITKFKRDFQLVNMQEQVNAARLYPCQIREPRILISRQVIKDHLKWSHFK